jgi:hypothetical protein
MTSRAMLRSPMVLVPVGMVVVLVMLVVYASP